MVSNPNKYSEMNTGGSLGDIRDNDDFPHTGLIKALSSGMGQNYAISGFDASSINATAVTIAAGVIFKDGEMLACNGASLTLSSTYSTGYHLLVAPDGNSAANRAVVLRAPTAAGKVNGTMTAGDTIIAVLAHTGSNPMQIQYLTVDKDSNSLSIGHDDSGYTEAMSITSNAGDVSIENKVQDKDIIIKGNDGGVSTTIATFDVSATKLLVPNRIETNTLLLGYATGPAKLQVYNAGDDMELYAAGDSGGNVKILELDAGTDGAEANRIATVTGNLHVSTNVGIGTTSPSEMLHLSDADASEPTILIENTGTSTTEPNLMFKRSGSHPSDPTVDIGRIGFEGDNDADQNTLYAAITGDAHVDTDGDERGRMRFHVMRAGAITEVFRLGGFEVTVNESSNDVDFRVEGNTVTNLLKVNAGADTVGIGSDAPDHTLTVNGTIARKGLVRNVTTIIGASGPPVPLVGYSVLDTDDIIIASAPSGGVPPNSLDIQLPDAAAEDIGRTYRIVAIDVTAGLTLNRTGSDDVFVDEQFAGISLPLSLALGKVYDITCIDTNKWMVMTLN